MNVSILSKFPPLEGGISARTYWLAKAYADAGLNVHVISNANLAERDYRIEGCLPHLREIPRVTLHEVEAELPWHIPEEPQSLAKLVDKALEVAEEHHIDVIDSGYLIPYGIAAMLTSELTGIPYVVRHGGSDLAKFLGAGRLSRLLGRVLDGASVIVTDTVNQSLFESFQARRAVLFPYVPDPHYFKPGAELCGRYPRLLYVGKINWHFERKSLDEIAVSVGALPGEYEMRWVAQGKGQSRFLNFTCTLGAQVRVEPFVPPWKVPELLRGTDYVFCLSRDEPIRSFSNILIEAAYCGARVVVRDDFDAEPYRPLYAGIKDCLLTVETGGRNLIAEIKGHLSKHDKKRQLGEEVYGVHATYCNRNVQILEEVAR